MLTRSLRNCYSSFLEKPREIAGTPFVRLRRKFPLQLATHPCPPKPAGETGAVLACARSPAGRQPISVCVTNGTESDARRPLRETDSRYVRPVSRRSERCERRNTDSSVGPESQQFGSRL